MKISQSPDKCVCVWSERPPLHPPRDTTDFTFTDVTMFPARRPRDLRHGWRGILRFRAKSINSSSTVGITPGFTQKPIKRMLCLVFFCKEVPPPTFLIHGVLLQKNVPYFLCDFGLFKPPPPLRCSHMVSNPEWGTGEGNSSQTFLTSVE